MSSILYLFSKQASYRLSRGKSMVRLDIAIYQSIEIYDQWREVLLGRDWESFGLGGDRHHSCGWRGSSIGIWREVKTNGGRGNVFQSRCSSLESVDDAGQWAGGVLCIGNGSIVFEDGRRVGGRRVESGIIVPESSHC